MARPENHHPFHKFWLSIRIEQQHHRCYWCRKPFLQPYELNEIGLEFPGPLITGVAPTSDHLIPIGLGGPDTFENIVAACFGCNNRRGCTIGSPFWLERIEQISDVCKREGFVASTQQDIAFHVQHCAVCMTQENDRAQRSQVDN
jgi:hypothetical protein